MNNLNKLAKQYKKTKDNKIIEQIYKILDIKNRAKFIFYHRDFFGKNGLKICETKQVELKDVEQELYLFVLKIIDSYSIKLPFENYVYSSLKFYKPSFINVEFLKSLKTQSIYQFDNNDEEKNIADTLPTPEPINIEFNYPLTEEEQKVWELLRGNLNLSQTEIAEELGVSQKTVSNVIANIKDKIQK